MSARLVRLAIALGLLAAACVAPEGEPPLATRAGEVVAAAAGASPGNLDLLFMIDNSSEMTEMQGKLVAELPAFVTALESLPMGLPNIHIAVVSSDLGAPGDATASLGCTNSGDQGLFQTTARASCMTTLAPDQAYLSNVGGVANYTGDLGSVLSCIALLGDNGCGFEHQLGSIARALGADGSPAPSQNAGFLRPDAELAIILLSNEDDCSAPATTPLYSLNNEPQNLTNSLGPLANYRCNEFGHLCLDASGNPSVLIPPPEMPPADVQGTPSAPTLDLVSCESNETDGLLTPVSTLVNDIKALKSLPAEQIVVGAIVAPVKPYTVAWVPALGEKNLSPGELWPQMEHSCGPAGGVNPMGEVATDGSFGDPAVRISEWVEAFGDNGVTASICDGSYASAFTAIVAKIGSHLQVGGAVGPAGGGGVGMVGLDAGVDGAPMTGVGGSAGGSAGAVGASGGGTGAVGATGGRGGSGQASTDGLREGCGCDVSRDRAGGWSLEFLLVLLAIGRRRAHGVES